MDQYVILALAWALSFLAFTGGTAVAFKAPKARPPSSEPLLPSSEPQKELGKAPVAGGIQAADLPVAPQPVVEPTTTWVYRLKTGLSRTHRQMVRSLDEFFLSKNEKATREEAFEKLFEVLIQADVGFSTSEYLVNRVKERISATDENFHQEIKSMLKEEILAVLENVEEKSKGKIESPVSRPHVVLMVGVNGVGKTTTTGKLAFKAGQRNQKVVVGAADTFRAAAVEQLGVWAERANALMIRLKEGADPASVAFEAVKLSKENDAEICLIDTAGRLHNRQDLMQELAKIKRSASKGIEGSPHEVLLVLDATTGQNALQQARIFREVVEITGLVLTKLDGTAKGGVAIAISNELRLPIRYVGVGESVEDLESFHAREFVDALFTS